MRYIDWLDNLNLVKEKERLEVLMIVFISVVLKKTDSGNGYNFKTISKHEFEDLFYDKILNIEFDLEMKKLVIRMLKTINEYDKK